MAKADDTSSTIDWIWLSDALALAAKALGSKALSEKLLKEWLTAGKLPWSCMSWKGLDEEGLAKRRQRKKTFRGILSIPLSAYHPGDPRFWSAHPLWIDWEDNSARETRGDGAQALGIRVSHAHLLSLLPAAPGEHEETHAKTWITAEIGRMKKVKKIPPGITITKLSRDLEDECARPPPATNPSARLKQEALRTGFVNGASGRLLPSDSQGA